MICPHCRKDTRLTTRRKGNRIRKGLLNSTKTIGRPKKGMDDLCKTLRSEGNSLREIARKVGLSTWAVRQRIKLDSDMESSK